MKEWLIYVISVRKFLFNVDLKDEVLNVGNDRWLVVGGCLIDLSHCCKQSNKHGK